MLEDALGSPTGTLEIPGSNPGDPIFYCSGQTREGWLKHWKEKGELGF